jgi:uncharacterized protein YPO0396
LKGLRERETRLRVELAGHGGSRLAEIERQIEENGATKDARLVRYQRFRELLGKAGLPPVDTPEQFVTRQAQIAAARQVVQDDLTDSQNQLNEATFARKQLDDEAAAVNSELRSLREHKNNIPARDVELRTLLCRELKLTADALPFAGELIAVLAEEADWEGAAERLLHGFALSVLVPDRHYAGVADWINGHHLNGRIVYYRVPENAGSGGVQPAGDGGTLFAKLDIKDSPFAPWLERELAKRADVQCVETMAEFRRMPRAITKAGQVKGVGGRHEKDDRRRIDDRGGYVLGWSNERKIDALVKRAAGLAARIGAVAAVEARHREAMEAAIDRRGVLVGLDQTQDYAEIDWQSIVNRIARLQDEHATLKAASAKLAELGAQLDTVTGRIEDIERGRTTVNGKIGAAQSRIGDAESDLTATRKILAEPGSEQARGHFGKIAALLAKVGQEPPDAPSDCDRAQVTASHEITVIAERRSERRARLSSRIVSAMSDFRRQYPVETSELDNAVESADGYRELHGRLTNDDLPRFQRQFKTYLNQNTIRDIAGFQSQLNKQAALIRERIATINLSLVDVDYNPGRYIRLEAGQTPHQEIHQFRADLRACTDDAVSAGDGDDRYSEEKFLQVSRIIERFRGREGQTETDRRWTRFVTDVRNWFLFSASERFREDHTEYEHYADSAGKSGGQKEKLAYTILAASLAYQFKLDWGAVRSRAFQFAVIDEAFGRGSDESTRFALELFGRLGLQLLIVTPLQKIHVIEPYVSAVGFVDNPTSQCSRLQTLTIEEYNQRRLAHALGGQLASAVA